MKRTNRTASPLIAMMTGLALTAALQAAPVIHESGNYSATTNLNGVAATGTGLSGNWSNTSANITAQATTWTYGALPQSNNQIQLQPAAAASVPIGPELAASGLLADGATLWFSFIIIPDSTASTNDNLAWAFGTNRLGTGNATPMDSSGNGVGVAMDRGTYCQAAFWQSGSRNQAGPTSGLTKGVPNLIVGRVDWGGTGSDPEKVTIYLPATDLVLPAPHASVTTSAALDQSTFDTITFSHKDAGSPDVYDEIRFGATYLDVIGASPASAYWDIDAPGSPAAGAGGTTPSGDWNASTTPNWNTDSTGTSATTTWTAGQMAVFSAGTDAAGLYEVAVDATQSIGGLSFEDGTVTVSGGTALDLVSTGGALLVGAPSTTATVSTPIAQTTLGGFLYKEGSGTLELSGNNTYGCPTIMNSGTLIFSGTDNSAATGDVVLNAGLTEFDAPGSINGTGENVTINSDAALRFGTGFDAGTIATALADRIVPSSSGTIAADNFAAAYFDFNTPGLTGPYLGAIGPVNYTGTLTPNGTAYRLGGGGGTLTLNSALTSGHSLAIAPAPGTVQLNGFNTTVSALTGGAAGAVLENGSASTAITLTVNNSVANTFSGSLRDGGAASLSLTKGGTNNLTLTGSNDFSGNIQIGAGTLTFANLAAWGGTGKNVTVTGTSTLTSSASGYTGGTLTVNGVTANTAGSNLNFATTTGTGDIVSASGNVTLDLGDASGFTGNIKKIAGGNGGTVQFNSLSDGVGAGNLQFGGGSNDSNQRITMRYAGGSAPLELDNRRIEFQAKPNNWSFRNAILENNSGTANTWVINTDLLNVTDRDQEFTLSGNNTGDNEFAGLIGDSTRGSFYSTQTGQLNLYKTGAGRWLVSGANTFTGRVLVNQGTLSVGTFNEPAVAGPLGMGTLIQMGGNDAYFNGNNALFSGNNSGTLEYTGGAVTSSRTFQIGDLAAGNTGGGTIANNGAGALVFSAANFNNAIASITATRTLTLGGSNAASNEIQGIIQDNVASTGKVKLTKSDSGIWILSGANAYTGATTIDAGTLLVNGSTSSSSAVSVNNTATLGGTGTIGGSVTVQATGGIAPGASAGTLTIAGDLDISALAGGGAGTLAFELNTPGTSDQIAADTLTIGTDLLRFTDFTFSDLGGLADGTYVLITTTSGVSTSVDAANASGAVGSGTGTLAISGNNLVLNVTGIGGGSPYSTWAGGAVFTDDDNGDGVDNGLAWILGALNPSVSALNKLPTVSTPTGYLQLAFTRENPYSPAKLYVEYGNDLTGWTKLLIRDDTGIISGSDVEVVVSSGTPDSVQVKIPTTHASGGKLFARLSATEN